MDIASTEHYHIRECGNCAEMFFFRGRSEDAITALMEQYDNHLSNNPECKNWHDKLPTLMDLKGILKRED